MKKHFYSAIRKTGRIVHDCIVFAESVEHAHAILTLVESDLGIKTFNVREA